MNEGQESTLNGSRKVRTGITPETCRGEWVPPWRNLQKSCCWAWAGVTPQGSWAAGEWVSPERAAPRLCRSDPVRGGGHPCWWASCVQRLSSQEQSATY